MSQLSLGFLVFEYTYIHINPWTFEASQPRQAEMSHKYYRNWQKECMRSTQIDREWIWQDENACVEEKASAYSERLIGLAQTNDALEFIT